MGKTALCIHMLELLNTGRIFKVTELASLLETNPRNIIEYKKELEEAGYYIDSISGRYGGYKLDSNSVIPVLHLNDEEKRSIIDALNYVLAKKDFLKKELFTKAIGKISSSIQLPENPNDLLAIDHYQLSMDESDIQLRYNLIEKAINEKKVIEIEYYSIKNGLKTHVLHPYKLFIYNNSWFFLAWNPEVGDVWYFKLNRIKSFKQLNETFRVWKYFKFEDYFDSNGFKNNGEFYHVEFIVSGVYKHLLSERIYGKNQQTQELDDGRTKVIMDMQNKEQIISFVLSCGENIEVIEPKWLINQIKEIAVNIIDKYSGEMHHEID